MKVIHHLIRQSWPLMLLAALAGLVNGASGASLAKTIGDGVSAQGAAAGLGGRFAWLCAAFFATKLLSELVLIHLTQDAVHRLRVALSRKLLATPVRKLQALGHAELLAIMTNDINLLVQAFQMLPQVFGNLAVVAGCMAWMAWLSWPLALAAALLLGVGLAIYHVAEYVPLRYMYRLREQMGRLYQDFRDLIEGSRELQLNARKGEQFVAEVVVPDSQGFKRLYLASMGIYSLIANLNNILFYGLIGAVVFAAPLWIAAEPAVLTAFALILLFLIKPINDMLYALPVIRQAGVALDKIAQLEGDLDAAAPPPAAPAFERRGGPLLALRQVVHHYPGPTEDRQFMLGPIDLAIERGEIVFIVGGNGSGKTTLAMLILGLYPPERGSIALDGQEVTAANLAHYRQHFSAVFADFHLFEQLLEAGQPELQARAMHYLDKLGMAHKVQVADGKFSTVALSSGQRKRLALVSAYLEDRPIYLFDEWAADQDPAFKRVFYTELLPELKRRGKTVLIVSHDDAYFACADRIVKLEDGQLKQAQRQPEEDLCV
ncbi:cyclic peptide export ABC transporter [Chitinimonas koreensis]|uniref:cyclic peptide export ABC transporter n=1 Tax=Chitinimonas koreensis TaxID=356302 RepID=UPI0004160F8A|nr:cyclic peptide export ABC transporter [Chitinimonas koreensis]QNM96582.1 cyclic peptide export ABC transporter [Chitinimonas koreensis]